MSSHRPSQDPDVASTALERLQLDSDIAAENEASAIVSHQEGPAATVPLQPSSLLRIPLSMSEDGRTHVPNAITAHLFQDVGGLAALRPFTTAFYKLAFEDPHLDQFIRLHSDPHGERFATWIAEKLGGTNDWTQNRQDRPQCPFHAPGVGMIEVHDRSSAHFAAWHSPKRSPEDHGRHFGLGDCRHWMRLHFWAARDSGIFNHRGFGEFSYLSSICLRHFDAAAAPPDATRAQSSVPKLA